MVGHIKELSMHPSSITFTDLLDQVTEYHIPLYQRDYTWSADEVGDFIDDFLLAFDTRTTRFFGTILLSKTSPDERKDEKRQILYVIDGQQRMTTLLLCLVALRHLAFDLEELRKEARDTAASIQQRLTVEAKGKKRLPRLYANRENNVLIESFLKKEVESRGQVIEIFNSLNKKQSRACMRLFDAYQLAYLRLRDAIIHRVGLAPAEDDNQRLGDVLASESAAENCDEKIEDVFDHLIKHSLLVKIRIDDWTEAFDLFDGLNNRGMELAKRDVLKNLLLSRATKEGGEAELKEVEKRWNSFEAMLPEAVFGRFLRHLLLLKHPDVSLAGATRLFLEDSKNETARNSLDNLTAAAEHYKAIIDPSTSTDLSDETKSQLQNLLDLSAERVRPIILACLLRDIDKNSLNKVLRALEILFFRRSSICQQDNKTLEGLVQRLSEQIYLKGKVAIDSAIDDLSLMNPSDDLFRKMFENKSGMPAPVARYMLRALESHQSKLPVTGGTLEHILPQDPGEHWGLNKDDPETKELIGRIGNLTLLKRSENSFVRNLAFDEKKAVYGTADESLKINALVVNQPVWTREEIVKRQEDLADMALAIWPASLINAKPNHIN